MNRKPIFDTVRTLLQRGFTAEEVRALDMACDRAETPALEHASADHRLGGLSARFESGGRGPGTVSAGTHDPGGPSYGTYQFASRTGTCAQFLLQEGSAWAGRFGPHKPGEPGFGTIWKAIAAEEPERFGDAQHLFIERTHYRPVARAIKMDTGLDIDSRSAAVRDVIWSCAVQHGGAARIAGKAVAAADAHQSRADPSYDAVLIEAIYRERAAYVSALASRATVPAAQRRQLLSIVRKRYPMELAAAQAMLAASA